MKKKRFATDFSVGFVLFVATVVVITSLFFVGDGKGFFADHVEYMVRFPSVQGLKMGSPVFVGGVQAGVVKRIEFPEDLQSNEVIVTLLVEKDYKHLVRADSFAWLETQGLFGDMTVQVRMGTRDVAALNPGEMIKFKAQAMLDKLAGEGLSASTTELMKKMVSVLEDMNKGQGTLGQLLKNPELYDNLNTFTKSMASVTQEVDKISKELGSIISEVRSQKGTLGQILFSEGYAKEFASALREANSLLSNLKVVSEDVKAGKGSIGKLFADSTLHDETRKAVEGLASAASRMDGLLARAESSRSVLGRLATDGDLGRGFEDLVLRLERSSAHIEKIVQMIASGEGSLGLLVQDPSIATSLRDVFLGVKEAGLLTNVVRNAERDGREAYLRQADLSRRETEEVLRVRALSKLKSKPGPEGTPVPAAGPEEQKPQ